MNNKGFTLVELSIVLVIIGLLTGGVLTAQSMINTTKINSFVRQVQQYDIAVSNFALLTGGQLPGDTALFAPAGNNDRDIEDITVDTPDCNAGSDCYESMSFWKHLSDAKMVKDTYTNDWSALEYVPGLQAPKTSWNKGVLTGDLYSASDMGRDAPKGHYWSVAGYSEAGNYPPGADWLAIDKKFDDGIFDTGVVRAADYNFGDCTATTENCYLNIVIGNSTGQPLIDK